MNIKTNRHQQRIGQKIVKTERNADGSCYSIELDGGGVATIGNPNHDPMQLAEGAAVGAVLCGCTLETDREGRKFWKLHFSQNSTVKGDCSRMETSNEVWKLTPEQEAEQGKWIEKRTRFHALPYREKIAAIAAAPDCSPEEVDIFLWEAREMEFYPYYWRVESILALKGQKPHALVKKAMQILPADMREALAYCVGDMASRRWPITFPCELSGEQAALAALK